MMKKIFTILLSILLVTSLAACSSSGDEESSFDFSSKPEDFEEWTTQDVIDYFYGIGVFTDEDAQYIQTDVTDNPCPDSLTELGSYMTDTDTILIYWMDPDDDRELVVANYTTMIETMAVDMTFTDYDETYSYPCSYVLGRFGFTVYTSNPEFDTGFDQGMTDLADHFGLELKYQEIDLSELE